MSFPSSLAQGRYLLVEPLGEGGMATVFRAYDQRLQVWRALKILSPDYAQKPRIRARFEAEAQTMALLEHRHIVRVYDVGREGDCAFIVMELVEGGALVDWLDRHGAMPPRMAVEVAIQICDGIHAAHVKGVIHRDIKPHNVLVTLDGTCRVTDFGIARVGDSDHGMTRTGAVMGTWGYMAPEQRSNAKGVDVRADVYAIGATLYTLLTNKMPMDLFAADRDDSMMAGVPEPLVALLVKSSEYRREDRFADVKELKAALRAVLDELPEPAADAPPLYTEPAPPPPIPRPESQQAPAADTILPDEGLGAQSPTILPSESGHFAPTVPPSEEDAVTGSAGQQSRPTFDPTKATGGINPSLEGRVAFPPSSGKRSGAGPLWVMAGGMSLLGLGLVAVAVLAWVIPGGVVPREVPEPPPAAASAAVEPEAIEASEEGTEAPTPTAEVEPATEAPVVEAPAPETPPARAAPPKTPRPRAQAAPPPEPSGTAEAEPEPEPQKVVVVQRVEQPSQCVQAQAPGKASVGELVLFRAKLCEADGSEVTLWYRPAGGGSWQSRSMPLVLGSHQAKVQVDSRFSAGIEYYVMAGSVSSGSDSAPHLIPVY